MKTPLIYNLFPRLVGPTTRWADHARRAREMAFNWLYINPWHYPGFSGSLYAPKEFRRLNPLFLPAGADPNSLEPLAEFLREMNELDMPVMMDLVVNHTSKDCPLVEDHPEWYVRDESGEVVSPSVVDPDDPQKITVWGDLAEIDNRGTPDREGLWGFWAGIVREALELGFSGFRCDAAYMVPAELWKYLIEEARSVRPEAQFFAETLGAQESAVLDLREAGFDYFFNSSKWWNFRDGWALEQHERFGRIAPSISFPETHDTERLAAETGGDEAVQRQRYAFAAAFSAGVMIPIGYEFGFRKRIHVVETMPSDWERRSFDLQPFIRRVNRLKLERSVLQGEGSLRPVAGEGSPIVVLERRPREGGAAGYVIVNTDAANRQRLERTTFLKEDEEMRLFRVCLDDFPAEGEEVPEVLELERAETAYVLPPQ